MPKKNDEKLVEVKKGTVIFPREGTVKFPKEPQNDKNEERKGK